MATVLVVMSDDWQVEAVLVDEQEDEEVGRWWFWPFCTKIDRYT